MKENSEETLSSQIFQLLNSFYVWNLTLPLLRFFGFYTTPAANQLPAFNKEELDFIAKSISVTACPTSLNNFMRF